MSKSKVISALRAGPLEFLAVKYPDGDIIFTLHSPEVVVDMPKKMATFFCTAVEAVLKREKTIEEQKK